ncbi:MAG: 4,5-DOPA dioxygenase extradiol [Candidatus Diapherotrites archaeon]|nr:4,5-DOPA dioxygenase extradiol [Candidatus Diapherotrites archaeon]
MPVLFVGHGSPQNAVEHNEFTHRWKQLPHQFSKPAAVLCVSAHWVSEGTRMTAMEQPSTIHDFTGFPPKLQKFTYPAPGSPALAQRVQELVKSVPVKLDSEWGLDHGCWSVLKQMYPAADVPVVELSIDSALSPSEAFRIGKELASLREEKILLLGTGNLVHTLGLMQPEAKPFPWAIEFEQALKSDLQNNPANLVNFSRYPHYALAQPSADHLMPLLYVLGAAGEDKPEFFNERIVMGSISMASIIWGKDYSEGQKELDRHFLNTCRKHSNSAFLGKYLPVSSKN